MTNHELHNALLLVDDRDYRFVLDFLADAGFQLPDGGDAALAWCKHEAESGSAEAQFSLAKLLAVGLFVAETKESALAWCRKAADQNFPAAINMLAGFYEAGWAGLSPEPSKIVELRQSAAALGDVSALSALGGMYWDGLFVKPDRKTAFALYRRAAEAGDMLSQHRLGLLLVDDVDPALEAEGLRWIQEAARQGLSSAHRQLGAFYSEGEHGLPLDVERARFHIDQANRLDQRYM